MNNSRLVTWGLATLCLLLAASASYLYYSKFDARSRFNPGVSSSSSAPGESEPAKPAFPDITMKAQAGRVAVIMYHDVIKERDANSVWFDCTVEEFRKDIDEIVSNGFTVLSLDQLYKHLTEGEPVPANSVVLTFDDNYQGIYDNALPILRQHKFPAAVFVHTAFVGNKQGFHPKMDWTELKELHDEGLVAIGAHTVSHPADLKALPPEQQKKELIDSKATLEEHLGGPVVYMAYPDGSNDFTTQELTREAGYRMSFTMEPTPAEGSPNILCVGRYEAKKFDQALKDQMQELQSGPVAIADVQLKSAPVAAEAGKYDGTKLVLLRGGTPVSVLSEGREPVGQFVTENSGVAGINGSFFVMSDVASTDNRLIGPARPRNKSLFMPDTDAYRLTKLKNRPMVIWGPTRLAIMPFQPGPMNQEQIFTSFMPDYSDAFLAGAWLVHEGVARTKEEMTPYASKDIMDFRKRAFFGITKDGEVLCGASQGSITSEELAKAAAAAGAYEAVLLDSGFSTSVVFDGQILVSGHSNIEHASRPVPHAIVLQGEKGLASLGDLRTVPAITSMVAEDRSESEEPSSRHRRKRRRR